MLRSVLSVLGGFAAIFILVMISTIVLARAMLGTRSREDMMKMKPTFAFTLASLGSSGAIAMIGGWLTAVIAPRAPLNHVCALAGLMVFMGVFSYFATKRPGEPKWYSAALVVLGPGCALLGGWLNTL